MDTPIYDRLRAEREVTPIYDRLRRQAEERVGS